MRDSGRSGQPGLCSRHPQALQEGIDPFIGVTYDSLPFFRIIRLFEVGDELRPECLERGKVLAHLCESLLNQAVGEMGPKFLRVCVDSL